MKTLVPFIALAFILSGCSTLKSDWNGYEKTVSERDDTISGFSKDSDEYGVAWTHSVKYK